MRPPLDWTDGDHAYSGKAHFHVNKRDDKNWNVGLYSMATDKPGGLEEKLGDYVVSTLEDGKQLAQALADQRGVSW